MMRPHLEISSGAQAQLQRKTGRGWHHTAAPRVAGQWGRGNNRLQWKRVVHPIVPGKIDKV